MRDKQRKKAQKKISKYIREMNKCVERDHLWRGRFYGHQIDASWYRYADGSGGWLSVKVELRDKKTLKTKVIRIDNYDYKWRLAHHLNDFIIEDCHDTTWGNRKELYDDITDYRKVEWKCLT